MAVLFLLKFTECYLSNSWRKSYSHIYMALFQCRSSGANLTISQFCHVVGCTTYFHTKFRESLSVCWSIFVEGGEGGDCGNKDMDMCKQSGIL